MFFRLLINASIEKFLNIFFYIPSTPESVRNYLNNKVLCISLQELVVPITFIFNEYQIDILGRWEGKVDCYVTTCLKVLPHLYNCQKISNMTFNNLKIEGDSQVIQNFILLISLSDFNLKNFFPSFIGDFLEESINRFIYYWNNFLYKKSLRIKYYVADLLIEEWRYAPGHLEVAHFVKETTNIEYNIKTLINRLEKWEKDDNK